jgi:hypothetical protein
VNTRIPRRGAILAASALSSTAEDFARMVTEEGARYAEVIHAAKVPLN